MNVTLDLRRAVGDYFNLAQRYVTETEDLLIPGRTIAQSPAAFDVLRTLALRTDKCGGHGWLMVFEDRSAVMTSNTADYIWPRWVV